MTGDARRWLLSALVVIATGCLEWEQPGDASAGEPEVPALHTLCPALVPPVSGYDPGDPRQRCAIACGRYVECFGIQVDAAQCESDCLGEGWIADADDLACFGWSPCTELWLCAR